MTIAFFNISSSSFYFKFSLFIEKSKEYIVRGDVVWVEFGFNIGEEFSGRHPAVVLKNGGKTLLVLPITSKQPHVIFTNTPSDFPCACASNVP